MRRQLNNLWQSNKSFLVFILLMLVFRSAVADWNDVPTGSMKPTIIEGDRILINKLAYDINVPFINYSLWKISDPKVNDIVIFESKIAGKRLVKRIIGLPGDKVAMVNNKLQINGNMLQYQFIENNQNVTVLSERNHNTKHNLQLTQVNNNYGNFTQVTVPENHYLVLGDNRNNSADSRVIGFVPREEIIGRTNQVAFSLDYENNFLPRIDRFFHAL